jgi:UDP-N-acetyl-2-amino-2-deoxyglucuronate dehydrogenase
MSLNFALIGAGGYIAPKHMRAIKEVGGNLVAALDKHDSVGVLDDYFPDAAFFVEFERFDRHLEKLKRQGTRIDYLVVCSPNYLHDSHIRFGLRLGANVICEKPVVLNPWNVDALMEMEQETGKKIFTVMQLRYHPAILELKQKVESEKRDDYNIELKYISSRGNWYHSSWKGDISKSGGIATNIGIHFFDMLLWIFGDVRDCTVDQHSAAVASGTLNLSKAKVKWLVSIDAGMLPPEVTKEGKKRFRSIIIDGKSVALNDGFDDLHTISYREILDGRGLGIKETKKCIELVHQIRNHHN